MPYKMVGKKRVFVEDDTPQKTVQPVNAAGLLAPISAPAAAPTAAPAGMSLADQLRAQSPGTNWDIQGIDRAQELAGFLAKRGVTDLSGASLKWDRAYTTPGDLIGGSAYNDNEEYGPDKQLMGGRLDFGNGVSIGNEGNIKSGNGALGYLRAAGDGRPENAGAFASSTDGHGAVSYQYVQGPDGKLQFVPQWRSSSDASEVRGLAAAVGGILSGGLGLGGMLGSTLGLGTGMAGSVVGNALVGGGLSKLGGGDFKTGLIAGGLGGAASSYFGAPAGTPGGDGAFLGEAPWTPTAPSVSFDAGPALNAYSAASPVTMADMMQTMPQISAPSAVPAGLLDGIPGIKFDAPAALESFQLSNPITVADLVQSLPQINLPQIQQPVQQEFRPSKDSQQYNADNNITQPVNTTPPKTVNLGQFDNPAYTGGTMGTAGGLQGMLDAGKQIASDTIGGPVKDAAAWMKDNPMLGRLLMGGATSLLSSSGSNSSGAPAAPSGPPVQWNSNLQQGLLSPVQQYAPAAITQNRPAGLLAQGYQNDGAWRYLKG